MQKIVINNKQSTIVYQINMHFLRESVCNSQIISNLNKFKKFNSRSDDLDKDNVDHSNRCLNNGNGEEEEEQNSENPSQYCSSSFTEDSSEISSLDCHEVTLINDSTEFNPQNEAEKMFSEVIALCIEDEVLYSIFQLYLLSLFLWNECCVHMGKLIIN